MCKAKYDILLEQKNKWEDLIYQTNLAKKGFIELMIELRKELNLLSQLKNGYPDSILIGDRIDECDKLLQQSTQTVNETTELLVGFMKEKEELIKKSVKPELEEDELDQTKTGNLSI